MQEISLDELDAASAQVEAAADATPLIDPWCSGPDWQIPVTVAFAPEAERLILATDSGDGFAMLTRYRGVHHMFGGMEPLWGFGTPIVGSNPYGIAAEVAEVLVKRDDWKTLFLTGMPVLNEPGDFVGEPADDGVESEEQAWAPQPDPTVTLGIANGLASLGRVGLAEGITRRIADLRPTRLTRPAKPNETADCESGYEQWFGRRTSRFRRNLRQAAARAESDGLIIEDAADDPHLFDRLMAIEQQTWKGHEGSGITSDEMSTLYRMIIERLQGAGRLHAFVARYRGADAGYILGGIRDRRYRGLQLSYTEEARHLSVGNLLQNHQLRRLVTDDLADIYDLGMDFEYKKRWADRTQTSVTLVVHRR